MDVIFRKTSSKYGNSLLSYFKVVNIAREEPRRYGKRGELLIKYEETEEHRQRQESVVSGMVGVGPGMRRGSQKVKGGLSEEKEMDVKI